ncbi:MAG: GH3 auxin-responsive promoter family protein [Bacteroidetes bacterium]|nr:GH3 auxin-responsive promoter family protein [Bacteroidota bacterium]HET6244394.1 GH3 auxin-responsive promoter family protein [Bacteroidia bacterium]
MGLKASLSKIFARYIAAEINKWSKEPLKAQENVFISLLDGAKKTAFGKDHNFCEIKSYADFKKYVPIRDYEGHRVYIDRIIAGENDVLWKGKPIYFCKTSGTTSGVKYIPITKQSISNHINTARNAILSYIAETGKTDFVEGKMIFLSGSPVLTKIGGINLGRLSGIVNHHVPGYLRKNQVPSYETNCIEDWEHKVDVIANETLHEKMTLISGIPSWVQMYFDKIIEKSGKKNIAAVFPKFSLFIYGGVNFEPYRSKFENTIGKKIDSIETYPASEGFIAFQDSQKEPGLLLNVNAGIFFEFIPTDEFFNENPTRIALKEVKAGINYVIILNTNAGLWGYNIGDTVKFVSVKPYRLIVTGRIKHFTSAFGEHVIAEEVDKAIALASFEYGAEVVEYTVAPQVAPLNGLPYHEWFIEFSKTPVDMEAFRMKLDKEMQDLNIYYRDLIKGNILQTLIIKPVQKDGFINYMKSQGKLGGQNKVPRLSNDRIFADELNKYI